MLETCRVINKNKYIERNLCVTLVIYQESLYDARSTKFKMLLRHDYYLRRLVSSMTKSYRNEFTSVRS